MAILVLTILFSLYQVLLAVYRLRLHPLSKFPGSPWAAISRWYEVYWQVYHPGCLTLEIDRLHKETGSSIIRVGPNEVHISNPEFHHEIFKPGSKFLKEKYHYELFCMPKASVGTYDQNEIRKRKEVYRPLFSKKRILEDWCWSGLSSKGNRLSSQLEKSASQYVTVNDAMACFTLDVIGDIAFSHDFGAIESPDFNHPYLGVLIHNSIRSSWISKLFPSFRRLMISMEAISSKLPWSTMTPTRQLMAGVKRLIEDYLANGAKNENRRLNAMDHFMSKDAAREYQLPDEETLNMEMMAVLGGGTETTANAATMGLYQVLTNPRILERLQKELTDRLPDRDSLITLPELEAIPYLAAVVKETIRWTSPLPGRLPRIVPQPGVTVDGHFLQPGTVVGMSAYITNRTEKYFPDPYTFNPDRWLNVPGTGSFGNLSRYVVTFSKGIGECPGMNTATAELYVLMATIFRRFDITLAPDTKPEDMEWSDHVVLTFNPERKLRARFTPRK